MFPANVVEGGIEQMVGLLFSGNELLPKVLDRHLTVGVRNDWSSKRTAKFRQSISYFVLGTDLIHAQLAQSLLNTPVW